MAIAHKPPGRHGSGGRLPGRIDDLRGPARGVIRLPKYMSWPGLRECDVGDDRLRRHLYGMLLAQGEHNDVARFVNAGLLRQDWPLIKTMLARRLARWCERRYGLGKRARAAAGRQASGPATRPG
ncbi:MAG: hypothetical protein LBV34_16640 [Nocardiopsaceae bacterium]|jgi:hypothetical protein|nr:hypothetical protein [Nocardiopsaceae bacterium]